MSIVGCCSNFRRKIAKIEQCKPDEVESEMLAYYDENAKFLKKRGLELW